MAQLLFIWLCMLGATRAMRRNRISAWRSWRSASATQRQLWLEMVCSVIILIFLAALVVEGVKLTLINTERTFGDSTLSYSWVTAAVPVGCVLLGIALIYNMVMAWQRAR